MVSGTVIFSVARAVKHCTAMPADGPGVGNALCGFFAGAPSK